MKALALFAAVSCAVAAPAQSGWRDLAGQPAPALDAETWLNTDGSPTLDSLKGKVWLLYFFATT